MPADVECALVFARRQVLYAREFGMRADGVVCARALFASLVLNASWRCMCAGIECLLAPVLYARGRCMRAIVACARVLHACRCFRQEGVVRVLANNTAFAVVLCAPVCCIHAVVLCVAVLCALVLFACGCRMRARSVCALVLYTPR